MYAGPSASEAAPVGASASSAVDAIASSAVDAASTSLSTTLESTSTQYLTVSAVPVNSGADSTTMSKPVVEAVVTGAGGAGGSASACEPPSTVTVTTQQFVTVVSGCWIVEFSSTVPLWDVNRLTGSGGQTATAPSSSSVEPTTLNTGPYGNGTDTNPTSAVNSTGFLTGSTGVPRNGYYRRS